MNKRIKSWRELAVERLDMLCDLHPGNPPPPIDRSPVSWWRNRVMEDVMPPRSEAQRKAMQAAAAGKSTIGIPKKVGKEYVKADPGGKLPKRKTK